MELHEKNYTYYCEKLFDERSILSYLICRDSAGGASESRSAIKLDIFIHFYLFYTCYPCLPSIEKYKHCCQSASAGRKAVQGIQICGEISHIYQKTYRGLGSLGEIVKKRFCSKLGSSPSRVSTAFTGHQSGDCRRRIKLERNFQ